MKKKKKNNSLSLHLSLSLFPKKTSMVAFFSLSDYTNSFDEKSREGARPLRERESRVPPLSRRFLFHLSAPLLSFLI